MSLNWYEYKRCNKGAAVEEGAEVGAGDRAGSWGDAEPGANFETNKQSYMISTMIVEVGSRQCILNRKAVLRKK